VTVSFSRTLLHGDSCLVYGVNICLLVLRFVDCTFISEINDQLDQRVMRNLAQLSCSVAGEVSCFTKPPESSSLFSLKPTIGLILTHVIPVNIFTEYLIRIHFNIILPSILTCPKWPLPGKLSNHHARFSHACYMFRPSDPFCIILIN